MPNTRKILIVDDDRQLRDALTEQLWRRSLKLSRRTEGHISSAETVRIVVERQ